MDKPIMMLQDPLEDVSRLAKGLVGQVVGINLDNRSAGRVGDGAIG
jgi:hypothetical protein